MSHARTTIRDAFATAVTGLSVTGANVFKSRSMPLDDDSLPGLLIQTSYEEAAYNEEVVAGNPQLRKLQIEIKGYDKLKSGLDDQLDDIAAEVETAIFSTDFDNVFGLDLLNTDIEIADGAEQDVGEIILTFQVQYMTEEGAPESPL